MRPLTFILHLAIALPLYIVTIIPVSFLARLSLASIPLHCPVLTEYAPGHCSVVLCDVQYCPSTFQVIVAFDLGADLVHFRSGL